MELTASFIIEPGRLRGTLRAQPSKSMSHRLLIGAALADGVSRVSPVVRSDDILATLGCLEAMGARMRFDGDKICVYGGGMTGRADAIIECYCGLSASTLRFLLPVALALKKRVRFTGGAKLFTRPMEPYFDAFPGMLARTPNGIEVSGALERGVYTLPGDVSSQFSSGLLFALPLIAGDSRISLPPNAESRAYIDMTLAALSQFGIGAFWEDNITLFVPGGQRYLAKAGEFPVPGDWSHASCFLVAGALGGSVRVEGLSADDAHPDRAIIDILRSMGANIYWDGEALVSSGEKLRPITADVSQCPDLAPAGAAAACGAVGTTRIVGAVRLRYKESNRLEGFATQLNAIGAHVKCGEDWMEIAGTGKLTGGSACSLGDHRIAMALAAVAAICENPLIIKDANCVSKSAPMFWEEFRSLGGKY